MIVGLSLIIGFAFGIALVSDMWITSIGDYLMADVMTILTTILFGLFGILVAMVPAAITESYVPEVEVVEKPIYALQDNFTTEGRYSHGIFYGQGYINEELNYFFIADADNRGRKVQNISIDSTYLNITEEQPTVEYHYKDTTYPKIVKVLCYPLTIPIRSEDYHVLNVPENSMTTEFNINLQ